MTVNINVSRYAKSLFHMAQESKELTRWQSIIRKAAELVKDDTLRALLANKQIAWAEKQKILTQRLGEEYPELMKLVALLIDENHLALLPDIDEEFQRLVDESRGIEGAETADVTTAIALDDAYRLKLAQRITEIVGKPVVLKTKVDPSIIGGIIIQVGDKLIDGSVRAKLAALKSELGGAAK